MPVIRDKAHQRYASQNDYYRDSASPSPDQRHRDLYLHKLQKQEHEQILKERARRFVSRMRKQREYAGGKFLLKKQIQGDRRQQQQTLIKSLMLERQEIQKSKKMTIALQKILINQCKKEKRMIKQLSQKLKSQNYEQSGSERVDEAGDTHQKQIVQTKPLKAVEPKKLNKKIQSHKNFHFPPIIPQNEQKLSNKAKAFKPTKPKQDKQIYLDKLDQIKLKSIDSKIKKLKKLYTQMFDSQQ